MGVAGILLAAGEGSRLRGLLGASKLEARVAGVPLICYPLAAMALAGVGEAFIATRRERASRLLGVARGCPLAPLVYPVESWRWWAGSAWTLLDALEALGRGVYLVSVGDHIYEPIIASRLLEGCGEPLCVAGDSRPRLADVGEATKIRVGGGSPLFGKSLEGYDYIDTGVHLLRWGPSIAGCGPLPMELNDLKNCNARRGLVGVVDVTGSLWIDIDSPRDLREATRGRARVLVERLRGLMGGGGGGEG